MSPAALKYLRETNLSPKASSYAWRIFSMMSLDHPYGLVGRCECCSSMGIFVGSPYVAQVDENTKRRTPAATKVSSSAKPCSTLFSKYSFGWVTDSPT